MYQLYQIYIKPYKGWMFESRGNVSLITRIWAALLSLFSSGLTGFYAFQNHCPPQPVPKLEETIKNYLSSMKDIMITIYMHHKFR